MTRQLKDFKDSKKIKNFWTLAIFLTLAGCGDSGPSFLACLSPAEEAFFATNNTCEVQASDPRTLRSVPGKPEDYSCAVEI